MEEVKLDECNEGTKFKLDDTFNPRCLLVNGIPLNSKGFGLKRYLSSLVELSRTEEMENKPHYIVKYNMHGHVRDGCCHIVFSSPTDAEIFLSAHQFSEANFENSRLTFSFGASSLRDHFFPTLPYPVRRKMGLDPVATYSVTGEIASLRMATCLLVINGCFEVTESLSIIDGTAGIGGNTIGLIRAAAVTQYRSIQTTAVELDPVRFEKLYTNLELALPEYLQPTLELVSSKNDNELRLVDGEYKISVKCLKRCGIETLLSATDQDILFFDPPWGGPNYAEKGTIDMQVSNELLPLDDIFARLTTKFSHMANVTAVKLPTSYNVTNLAKKITSHVNCQAVAESERHYPFRFHFDATMILFVLVRNPSAHTPENLGNHFLDEIILKINQWHGKGDDNTKMQGEQFLGGGVCKPEFYDYEKQRWILLKKWIPSSQRKECRD